MSSGTCPRSAAVQSLPLDPLFFARFHKRRYTVPDRVVAFVLISAISALVCPIWGLQASELGRSASSCCPATSTSFLTIAQPRPTRRMVSSSSCPRVSRDVVLCDPILFIYSMLPFHLSRTTSAIAYYTDQTRHQADLKVSLPPVPPVPIPYPVPASLPYQPPVPTFRVNFAYQPPVPTSRANLPCQSPGTNLAYPPCGHCLVVLSRCHVPFQGGVLLEQIQAVEDSASYDTKKSHCLTVATKDRRYVFQVQ